MNPESAWHELRELDESICSAPAGLHMPAKTESSNIGVLENHMVTKLAKYYEKKKSGSPKGKGIVVTRVALGLGDAIRFVAVQPCSCGMEKGAKERGTLQFMPTSRGSASRGRSLGLDCLTSGLSLGPRNDIRSKLGVSTRPPWVEA